MTDYHIHIGQFYEAYYCAENVFSVLKALGIKEVWFSSTTSCIYCKESAMAHSDKNIFNNSPTALELYQTVRTEVQNAKNFAASIGLIAHALYWVVPELHFSENASITIKNAMEGNLYDGFKIHPRAQDWSLEEPKTFRLAEELFNFAQKNRKLIMIHCDDDFSPRFFEALIASYSSVKVQLAHCRPKEETLFMLQNYPNVICDTSMASNDVIDDLKTAGFGNRLRFGSDSPITHWRKYTPKGEPSKEDLKTSASEILADICHM